MRRRRNPTPRSERAYWSAWRRVFAPGDPEHYAGWVRALRGKSGVYAIRSSSGRKALLYVGESHSDRLYETLVRHFSRWRRRKRFWDGLNRAEGGESPGLTYDRHQIEVRTLLCSPGRAVAEQASEIQRAAPRDNEITYDGSDEIVPF